MLATYLADTLRQCQRACEDAGIKFESDLIERDFIDDGVRMLRQEMFAPTRRFNCAILNPPYKKISSDEVGMSTAALQFSKVPGDARH